MATVAAPTTAVPTRPSLAWWWILGFVVVLVNALLAEGIARRSLGSVAIGAAVLLAVAGYGSTRLEQTRLDAELAIAIVQGGGTAAGTDPMAEVERSWATYAALTAQRQPH